MSTQRAAEGRPDGMYFMCVFIAVFVCYLCAHFSQHMHRHKRTPKTLCIEYNFHGFLFQFLHPFAL